MFLHFCTSIATNGVPKLAVLITSLDRHLRGRYRLWVLCEDQPTALAIAGYAGDSIEIIHLTDFEKDDQELLKAKAGRDAFEYNCTLRPTLILNILKSHDEIDWLTYVDNDLYFFNDPTSVYLGEGGGASVLITRHRLSRHAMMAGVNVDVAGEFNAGWVAVRNDDEARKVLFWWRERCNEWCFRFPSNGRFAEQKYLDQFPSLSSRVRVLNHVGVNVGPWNMNDLKLSHSSEGALMINDNLLIFYHFHALKMPGESSFKVDREIGREVVQYTNPSYVIPKDYFTLVYAPYVMKLLSVISSSRGAGYELGRDAFRMPKASIWPLKRLLLMTIAHLIFFGLKILDSAWLLVRIFKGRVEA